jgi:DNA-binding transcriptional MerR regulator
MARAAANEEKLYKIGEVCKVADLQPYVLRYWETEFPQLSPNKSGGGQRLYTKRELDIILRIKDLLYKEGFTIAGAKKKLEIDADPAVEAAAAESPRVSNEGLAKAKRELRELLVCLLWGRTGGRPYSNVSVDSNAPEPEPAVASARRRSAGAFRRQR